MTIPVLLYHKVGAPPLGEKYPDTYISPSDFESHVKFLLDKKYRNISIDEYMHIKTNPNKKIREKLFLLAFDDGSATLLRETRKIVKKYQLHPLLFVVGTGFGKSFYWDKEPASSGHRMMSLTEMKALAREGWTLGSHSLTHRNMHTLSSLEIKKEIAGSKLLLEKKLGLPIHWFAYPFGDYNKEAVKWVKQAGYKAAFSTEQGENFPFSIPRKSIGGINIRGKKFGACLQHAIRLSSL